MLYITSTREILWTADQKPYQFERQKWWNYKDDKLNQASTDLKAEAEAGHERNIISMTQVDEYKSPEKNKDASTIDDSAYYD